VPTALRHVVHLLRRSGFGGPAGEVGHLTGLDLPSVVDQILGAAAPPIEAGPRLMDVPYGMWGAAMTVQNWWIARMVNSQSPIHERIALFWHGHFVSAIDKVDDPAAMWAQHLNLRRYGLGRFSDLASAVTTDAALLRYLDNTSNRLDAINENFARELLELMTMGVGTYRQADVVAAAHAWTGHGVGADGRYQFHPDAHDFSPFTFLGSTRTWNGPEILDEVVNGAGRPATARHVATRLWSFLAYPNPEPTLVASLGAAFMAADLDITALLRAIFLRPEFYSDRARYGLLRTPVDFVVAALRSTGVTLDEVHLEWNIEKTGQCLLLPPNVGGWPQNEGWISASTFNGRAQLASMIATLAARHGVLADAATGAVAGMADRAMATFGITEPSPVTIAGVQAWLAAEPPGPLRPTRLMALIMLTPDFQLA